MHFEIEHINPPGEWDRLVKILRQLDSYLIPRLSKRVKIENYAKKVSSNADLFYVVVDKMDCANCAVYLNSNIGYITSIGVLPQYQKKGYGKYLITEVLKVAEMKGIDRISLHVYYKNVNAIQFYVCMGFKKLQKKDDWIEMLYVL